MTRYAKELIPDIAKYNKVIVLYKKARRKGEKYSKWLSSVEHPFFGVVKCSTRFRKVRHFGYRQWYRQLDNLGGGANIHTFVFCIINFF
jgi:hypothetical protein